MVVRNRKLFRAISLHLEAIGDASNRDTADLAQAVAHVESSREADYGRIRSEDADQECGPPYSYSYGIDSDKVSFGRAPRSRNVPMVWPEREYLSHKIDYHGAYLELTTLCW